MTARSTHCRPLRHAPNRGCRPSTSSAFAPTSRSLQRTVHGKPLVYLDNAATSAEAAARSSTRSRDYYRTDNANIHRGVHALSAARDRGLRGGAREGAALPQRRRRARRSSSRAARPRRSTWSRRATGATLLSAGDEIVISRDGAPLQHRAVADAVRARRAPCCAVVPINDAGELDARRIREAARAAHADWSALVHVSNALGTINPVAR